MKVHSHFCFNLQVIISSPLDRESGLFLFCLLHYKCASKLLNHKSQESSENAKNYIHCLRGLVLVKASYILEKPIIFSCAIWGLRHFSRMTEMTSFGRRKFRKWVLHMVSAQLSLLCWQHYVVACSLASLSQIKYPAFKVTDIPVAALKHTQLCAPWAVLHGHTTCRFNSLYLQVNCGRSTAKINVQPTFEWLEKQYEWSCFGFVLPRYTPPRLPYVRLCRPPSTLSGPHHKSSPLASEPNSTPPGWPIFCSPFSSPVICWSFQALKTNWQQNYNPALQLCLTVAEFSIQANYIIRLFDLVHFSSSRVVIPDLAV